MGWIVVSFGPSGAGRLFRGAGGSGILRLRPVVAPIAGRASFDAATWAPIREEVCFCMGSDRRSTILARNDSGRILAEVVDRRSGLIGVGLAILGSGLFVYRTDCVRAGDVEICFDSKSLTKD